MSRLLNYKETYLCLVTVLLVLGCRCCRRVPPFPTNKIRSLVGVAFRLHRLAPSRHLIPSVLQSSLICLRVLPQIIATTRLITLSQRISVVKFYFCADSPILSQPDLLTVIPIALCQPDIPTAFPKPPILGVDTIFDIHYNVGRNGAKWDAIPKNQRDQRRAWDK